jgi:outer membrane autotransporter protein
MTKKMSWYYKEIYIMKKIAIATIIALAAGAASALELGVTGARDYSGTGTNGYGITVGDKAGKLGGAVGFQRFDYTGNRQDRFTLIGSYDVATVGPATFAVKAGGAYLDNQTGSNGLAAVVGAGVSVPVTKAISVGLDVTRQFGQDRVSQFDGNMVTAGVKLSFR